jgi:hypothetical protein
MKNTFTKLMAPKTVTEYLKEAKRVGYIIEKDDMSFTVKDDETNDLVFKGIRMNRTFYGVTFSKEYWQCPDRGDGYSASILEEVK